MTKKTGKTQSKAKGPTAVAPAPAEPTPMQNPAPAPAEPIPIQRPATPEEQVQVQLAQQRARAEVAVLKQRFAETDVAMTIAQAEREQVLQQNQLLQQENEQLKTQIAALTNDEQVKDDNPSTESEDEQTTPADPEPEN